MRAQGAPAGRRESGPWAVLFWLALAAVGAVAFAVAGGWLWVWLLTGGVSLGPD